MEIKTLKEATTAAAVEAKKLVADVNDGRSPFAAGIRSNLDHANELIAQHEKWLAGNPQPKAAPAAK